jgi:uncharacterized protein YdcH (DUF465 family)
VKKITVSNGHLRSLSADDAEFARLAAQQRDVQRRIEHFSARDWLDRDAIHARADRLQADEALSHLIAIANGKQPHDFAAVSSVLAGRDDRLP